MCVNHGVNSAGGYHSFVYSLDTTHEVTPKLWRFAHYKLPRNNFTEVRNPRKLAQYFIY